MNSGLLNRYFVGHETVSPVTFSYRIRVEPGLFETAHAPEDSDFQGGHLDPKGMLRRFSF